MSLAAQTTPLVAALEQLGTHDHFCSIYESPQEHYAVAIPFIRIGLERGEKCIYIADDGMADDLREAMQSDGIDVDRAISSNALVLVTKEQAYLEHGSFHPDWMSTFWKEATRLALSEGFSALRATGETEWVQKWVQREDGGLERWMEYESRLAHTVAENKCSALCQYNRRLFPPELILDVIRTHPVVVNGGTVSRNLYYVPPEEFLGGNQTAREVERLLTNIRERERVDNALREQLKERRRAEEALRRSESYLAEAQKLSHTGSWAFDATTPLYWSEENLRIWGFDPKHDVPDRATIMQRIHPEDRDRVIECVQNAVREKRDYVVEFRIVLPDAAVRYIQGLGHLAFGASGELIEIIGTNVDMTERKQAEEAQLRLAAIVASSDDAIIGKTLEGIITTWNAGAERIFGYSAEEALGLPITILIPPDRQEEESQIIARLRRGESVRHFETVRIRKDGQRIHVSLAISPVKDAAGQIIGASKIARDITERNRAAEALREVQADLAHVSRVTAMGELTASLAHEVNQPITAAVTNANTCLRWLGADTPDIEEARAAVTRIVNDGTRAAEIIKRIRLLFKKGTPERELIDVNEVIREMIVILHGEATRYSTSVRTELAAEIPQFMGDRVQLQQVMMNLIMNSIDAMKDVNGTRELAIKSELRENEQVLVSVSDTGVGLPREQMDQIFNAFVTTKLHGTGMGLSISRSIVESHGGRLWATDNSPRGASFHFTLPTKVEAPE
jgi:PAS domain S-box-containing protein